jgi:hypothetical protein
MLEDISDPFNQFVNRPPRPVHSGGRSSDEGLAARRRIVSIPSAAGGADAAESLLDALRQSTGTRPATPITTAPGPGEVSSPSWWKKTPAPQS